MALGILVQWTSFYAQNTTSIFPGWETFSEWKLYAWPVSNSSELSVKLTPRPHGFANTASGSLNSFDCYQVTWKLFFLSLNSVRLFFSLSFLRACMRAYVRVCLCGRARAISLMFVLFSFFFMAYPENPLPNQVHKVACFEQLAQVNLSVFPWSLISLSVSCVQHTHGT